MSWPDRIAIARSQVFGGFIGLFGGSVRAKEPDGEEQSDERGLAAPTTDGSPLVSGDDEQPSPAYGQSQNPGVAYL